MNVQSAAEDLNADGKPLAPIIPISSARNDAGAVLNESEERGSAYTLQSFLDAIRDIEDGLNLEDYKEHCAHAFELMDEYIKKGLLVKNAKGKYEASPDHEKEGEEIIASFRDVMKALRDIKQSKPETDNGQKAKTDNGTNGAKSKDKPESAAEAPKPAVKPAASRKPEVRPASKSPSPLAVELDGKTFNSPGEAYDYANRLKTDAEAFRQRYFGLLTLTVEKINQSIDEAIAQIEKAERNVTKDNKVGVIDILKPFVEKGIARHERFSYKPNPDIERAKELTDAANKKMKAVNEQLEKDRKAFEERKARIAAYDEVLNSENGFWQTFTDRKGKEIVRFAYQIEVSRIPGTTIQQITVKKVAPLFGNVELQGGSVFVLGDKNTPHYLNKAARELLESQQPKAKIADVMPKNLGGNGKESK